MNILVNLLQLQPQFQQIKIHSALLLMLFFDLLLLWYIFVIFIYIIYLRMHYIGIVQN